MTPARTKRFWERVDRRGPDECWPWLGPKHWRGYGLSGSYRAHRVSYEINVGVIPGGLCVMHTCDRRDCVNPTHLKAGTVAENNRDMVQKGRHRTPPSGCHADHPADDVYVRPDGRRQCRRCQRAYQARHDARLATAEARATALAAALALYKDYVDFLHRANEEPIRLATAHVWRCSRSDVETGKDYRERIAQALAPATEGNT